MIYKPSLSLIIAAYNEAAIIEESILTCIHILEEDFEDFEIILVDDGSKDATGAIADTLDQKYPCVRVLPNLINLNLGVSIQRGMAAASKDIVTFNAADLPLHPSQYKILVSEMHDLDMLVLEREEYLAASKWRKFTSLVNRVLLTILFPRLKKGLRDTNYTQLVRKSIIPVIMPLARGPVFTMPEMIFRAKHAGLNVKARGIEYNPQFVRKGAFGKPHDIILSIYEMWRFRIRLWEI